MITIFSDCHFGFDYGKERENDPFDAVSEVMETALKGGLILIAGDIFDSRLPRTEVWARAMELLAKPLMKASDTRLIKSDKDVSRMALSGIPVVAIHGTHERRGRGLLNPIEALEKAGFLIHLHCQSVLFDVKGKRVAVHGMSGVPERYAKRVLEKWNPKPVPNAFNILLIHQSIDPYIYSPLEPPTVRLEDLPKGFDLVVDGHIHWSSTSKAKDVNVVFPGSLIFTQMKKIESETPKGFFTLNDRLTFHPLKSQRKLYHKTLETDNIKDLEDYLQTIPRQTPKPLVRLNIKTKKPLDLKLLDKFRDTMILSIGRTTVKTDKVELLQRLRSERLSVEEMGLNLLKDKLGFEADELVDALVNENLDRVMHLIKTMDIDTKETVVKPKKRLPLMKSKSKDLREFT